MYCNIYFHRYDGGTTFNLIDSKFHGTLIKEHETRVQIYFKTACVTLIKIGHTTFGIKFDWSTCHDNLGIILLLIT